MGPPQLNTCRIAKSHQSGRHPAQFGRHAFQASQTKFNPGAVGSRTGIGARLRESWMSLTSNTGKGARPLLAAAQGMERAEPPADRLRRWALGLAWALKPPRTRDVPAVLYLLARHAMGLDRRDGLPDSDTALSGGIAGICADLEVDTLMAAYARGLFPFCHVGPQKWWAPRERMVLFFDEFRLERNLRRRLRNGHFQVTFDRDFRGVVGGCAELRPGRTPLTWISPDIVEAYCALFDAGHAHSVEVWDKEGTLVGGAYGVAVGRVFFTESQFNRVRDAAKAGFATLNCHLQRWGFLLNDGKHYTGHLDHVGFRLIPRAQFNAVLAAHAGTPARRGPWAVDPSLDVGNWEPRAGRAAASTDALPQG